MKITYIGHATLLLGIDGESDDSSPIQTSDPKLGKVRLAAVSWRPGSRWRNCRSSDAILAPRTRTPTHLSGVRFKQERLPRNIPLFAPPVIAKVASPARFDQHATGSRRRWRNGSSRARTSPSTPAEATYRGNRYGFDRWRDAANMLYLLDAERIDLLRGRHGARRRHRIISWSDTLWANGRSRARSPALLPIGYAPWWKPGFQKGHLTFAEDALALFERLARRGSCVPYHWGTFRHVTAATAHDAIRAAAWLDRLSSSAAFQPCGS